MAQFKEQQGMQTNPAEQEDPALRRALAAERAERRALRARRLAL